MKQGQASHSGSGSTKSEPVSRAVSPGAVSRMGNMIGNHSEEGTVNVPKEKLFEGRGLKAPMAKSTTHKGGSQGSY